MTAAQACVRRTVSSVSEISRCMILVEPDFLVWARALQKHVKSDAVTIPSDIAESPIHSIATT